MRSYIPGEMPSICTARVQYVGSANTCKIYSTRFSQGMPMSTEWCTRRCVPIKASSKSLHWRHCATFFQVKTQLNDISTRHLLVRKYSKSKSGLCHISLARCQESETKWHRQTLMETFRVFFFGHWNYAALSHSTGSLSGTSQCLMWFCVMLCTTFPGHLATPFGEVVPMEAAVMGSVLLPEHR